MRNILHFLLIFGLFQLWIGNSGFAQGDNCGTATLLTSSTTCSAITGDNQSLTTGSLGCNTGATPYFRDGWYRFVATQNAHTVTVDGQSNFRAIVGVFTSATCAAVTPVVSCVTAAAVGDVVTVNLTGLTIGTNYYIQVFNQTASTGTNNNRHRYDICVTHFATTDDCSTATTLTPGATCTYITGDNENLTDGSSGCNTGTTPYFRDGWYKFVATQTTHNVTVDGQSNFRAIVGVFASCPAVTPVGGSCTTAAAVGDVVTVSLTGLTVGTTYYVQVFNQTASTNSNNNRHRYDICVTNPVAPPPNDVCSSPTVLTHYAAGTCTTTSGTVAGATQSIVGCTGTADDDVWYSFTATATTAEVRVNATMDEVVEIFSGACGSPTSLVCQDTPEGSVIAAGLTIGNVYLVRVYSWSSATQASPTHTICVTTPTVPANDNCAGAISLTHETFGNCTTTSATVANATQSLVGCTGSANDDVWFSFVATSAFADIKVSWVSDEVVEIFSASSPCAGLSSLVCQDSPEGSVVVGSLTVGQRYYVRVYSASSSVQTNPTFTICVTTPSAAATTNDACANAVSLTHQAAGGCTSQTYDISTATQSLPTCTGSTTTVRDLWYKFTATSTSAIIHRVTTFRSVIEVFNGGATPGACGGSSIDCYNPTEVWTGQQGDLQVDGLTVGNVYYFRIYPTSDTAPSPSTFSLCVSTPGSISNTVCTDMLPACSSSTITFQAQTGGTAPAGNNYGCLGSQPNPSWFYLQIGTPGTLIFTLGAAADIDYAVWGPYNTLSNAASACGTLPAPISCSYATTNLETATITGAIAGRVYVLLVTNYADVNQIIDIRQTGGTGTSDCSIVLAADVMNFKGYTQGKSNLIEWNAQADNPHLAGFQLQKSYDGHHFENLSYLPYSQSLKYGLTDTQVGCKSVYYRVEATHLDGTKKLSHLVLVSRNMGDCGNIIQIFPNPATQKIYIKSSDYTLQAVEYKLLDMKNKVHLAGKPTKTSDNFMIDIEQIPIGMYILQVKIDNQWVYEKIIKE